MLASILTWRLRWGGCLCVLTFIFYTVKAAYYSQLGKLQEHSLHQWGMGATLKGNWPRHGHKWQWRIRKYVQNLYNSKELDILYYILPICGSLRSDFFLAEVTEFENSIDFSLLLILEEVLISVETSTSYEFKKFCKVYCSLRPV